MEICGGVGEDPRTQSGASASTSHEGESDEGRQRPANVQRMPEQYEYAHRLRQRESGSRWWTWTSLRLRRRAWLHMLIFLLLASHGAIGQQQEERYLERPRTPASQKHWWDWQPRIALGGGVLGKQEVCADGAYIDKFIVSMGSSAVNANTTRAYRMKGMLSIQGRCSNGKQLGYYGPSASDASVIYSQENIPVVQPQGFTNLNGTGLGVVEGFMNVGEDTLNAPDGFSTPCPVGTRVDGYQVVVGALIYQIRPRCSCINCGCRCLAEWNYTSSKGNMFHITNGCANPDTDQPVPWCMVDPATCTHEPFAASTGSWDYCYNAEDTITVDTEKTANMCACQPSWSEITKGSHVQASGGGCADLNSTDNSVPWCYVIPETCTSPPQRRLGKAWDVCQVAHPENEYWSVEHGHSHFMDPTGTWAANGSWVEVAVNSTNATAAPLPPYPSTSGCKCNDSWSYTSPKTGQVYQMSGSAGCANPGGDRQLPWCKVDARTCAHVPRTESITSGDTFNFCTAPGSNTTLDTQLTVGECNCLPQYNYTVPETGLFLDIRNGSCIRPHRGSLPWCIVDPRTCIGKYRLLPDGQAWDSCAIPDINNDSAVTLAAAAAPEPAVPGAAAVRDSSGDATLEAVLQVVSAGLWTPANSNGFQAALLVQLHFHRDDDPEPLQDLVHTATIVSAVPRGPAARRLLNHQDAGWRRLLAAGAQATDLTVDITANASSAQRVGTALSQVVNDSSLTTYGHDQGMDLKSIKMLSMQVLPVDNSTANSTAVQSSGGGGGGLDLATIGKGIGIAAAGLIAISLCLTVTILELMKLNREAKAEEERKAIEAEASRKFGEGYRPSHAAQESDEFWMYDELKTRVAPDSLRQKFVNGGSVTLKDKDSDKMLVSRRPGELQAEDMSRASNVSRESNYSVGSLQTGLSGETGSLPSLMAQNDWEIAPMDIEIIRREDGSPWELGAGAFGKVYKGLWNEVQDVAVKMVVGQSAEQQARFLREIAILKDCRNVHVVQFLGACMHPGCTMLITELMAANAQDLIHSGKLPWREKGKQVALDSARGLAYLHRKRIAWLDCKSSNVLLTKEGTAKVADVGLAHVVHASHIAELDALGTFAYAAPELINGDKCNEKADIWSFGVLLHELITEEIPRRGKLRELSVPEDCTYEEMQLVRDCLQTEPDERPSAKDLVNRLAGSSSIARTISNRSSSLSFTGHISGQHLADSGGRGVRELMSGEGPMSLSALREQDRLSRERLSSRDRLSLTLSSSRDGSSGKAKSDVRIPIPPPS